MIKPLSLIVSLLLVMSYADEVSKIDLKRCGEDTVCYARDNCFTDTALGNFNYDQPDGKHIYDLPGDSSELNNQECDVLMQIKQFSPQQSLVIIELKAINTEEISIDQGGLIISCKKDTDPDGHVLLKPKLKYAEAPVFDAAGITRCSWILETEAPDEVKKVATAAVPTLKIGAIESIEYSTTGEEFWTPTSNTCIGKITFLGTSEEYFLSEDYDLFNRDITCPNGGKLLAKVNDEIISNLDKIFCKDRTNAWYFGAKSLRKKDPVEIGCMGKKYCASCSEMTKHSCVASNDCVAANPEANRPDGCMVMKCDDDKWTKDGRSNFKNEHVSCKKNSQGKPDWVRQDVTDGTVPPTGLGCLKKALCRGPNEDTDIKLNCPEGVEQCSPPVLKNDNQVMNCTEGLIFYVDGSPPVENPQCNDGLWSVKGEIYCAPPKEPAAEEKVGTGGMSGGTIAAIIAVIVVVGVIGGLVYFFVVKPKMAKKTSKAAGPSKKGAKSSKKSTESKSGAKKPSDSDPPEKASGKEGGVTPDGVTPGGNTPGPTPVTDLEKIKTEPSGPKTPEVAAAPGGAPGAPPPPPAAPAPGQSAV